MNSFKVMQVHYLALLLVGLLHQMMEQANR